MKALHRYLLKEKELSKHAPNTAAHDLILEEMDDLWWEMSDEDRRVRDNMDKGRWIRVEGGIVCPFCGHLIKDFVGPSPPPRCSDCMTDTIPGEFA